MFSYIHAATIVVSDQEAALDFYVNTLGWERVLDERVGPEMRFLTVVPPEAETQLALGMSGWFDDAYQPGGETGITLITPDIDQTYQTLSARGVKFTQPVAVMPWGQKATWFSDLDGNEFFLVEE
ncbi:MAG: VOC family protein [Sphaerobacter sp.]|nr:VOC family protein [Sphaerobacter sp.]